MLVQNPPLESRTPRLWNALVSLAALVLIGILPALSSPRESAAQEKEKAPQRKSSAAKAVEFAIGPNKFTKGDKIVIQEVWSELGSLANGDTVTVKGTYTLASHYTATLLFSVTEDTRRAVQGGCFMSRPARTGTVPFELEMPITVDGHLHVGFYDTQTGGAFGNVYFGTYAQMREIAHWDVEKWMNQGRRARQIPGR